MTKDGGYSRTILYESQYFFKDIPKKEWIFTDFVVKIHSPELLKISFKKIFDLLKRIEDFQDCF